jgi:hypothetical protein
MNPLATVLAAATSVYAPLLVAFAVIHIRNRRRDRQRLTRRPIGPTGNPVPDLHL